MSRTTTGAAAIRDSISVPAPQTVTAWVMLPSAADTPVVLLDLPDVRESISYIPATGAWRWERGYTEYDAVWEWPTFSHDMTPGSAAALAFAHVGTLAAPILYVGGVAQPAITRQTPRGVPLIGTSVLAALNDADGVSPWRDGAVDQLAVYGRVLPRTEVQRVRSTARYALPGLGWLASLNGNAPLEWKQNTASDTGTSDAATNAPVAFAGWEAPTLAATSTGTSTTLTRNTVDGGIAYKLERTENGTTWTMLTSVMATTYTDSGLQAQRTYQYRISTSNGIAFGLPGVTLPVLTQGAATPAPTPPPYAWQPIQVGIRFLQTGRTEDLTHLLTDCSITDDDHGYHDMQVAFSRRWADALHLTQPNGGMVLHAVTGPDELFEGRVEVPKQSTDQDRDTITLTAYGGSVVLDDEPYTAVWSDTKLDGWRVVQDTELGGTTSGRFDVALDGAITIRPQKDAAAGSASLVAYRMPSGGATTIQAVKINWAIYGPRGWELQVNYADADFGNRTGGWTRQTNGTSVLQNTDIVLIPAKAQIDITFWRPGGAANNTNMDIFARITGIQVCAVPVPSTLTPDVIMRAAYSASQAANPRLLSATTAMIGTPKRVLTQEVYADTAVRALFDRFAQLGDSTGQWRWAIRCGGVITFQPLDDGTARTWYAEVGEADLERVVENLATRVYAVYTPEGGTETRTPIAIDPIAEAREGFQRTIAVRVDSPDLTEAIRQRDMALQDAANPLPQVSVQLTGPFRDARNAPIPDHVPQHPDWIVFRALPLGSDIRVRRFRLVSKTITPLGGFPSITLESPVPSLETYLAQIKGATT